MKPVALAALTVAVCMSLTVMVPQADEASEICIASSTGESVLRIGYLQGVDDLNPFKGLSDSSYFFYSLVYDSLFSVGNDLETVGNLATEWRPVPLTDPEMIATGEVFGSVWEYNLTENAQWHDGEPLTADDVAWVINLNAENYNDIWAYQPYSFFMDYAEVVDSDTIRIHFYDRTTDEPIPVAYAESIYIPMVPRHKLSEMAPGYIGYTWNGTFWGSDPPIVGTGPFTVTEDIWAEFMVGDYLTLVKNPDYHWAADKGEEVQFDKIVMYFYDDPTAMSMALREGEIDVGQFPAQTYEAIRADVEGDELEDVDYYDGLRVTQYFTEMMFNMNNAGPNPARLDPAVRQALAMATNKEWIRDMFYSGLADVGTTLISPVNEAWHYEPTPEELYAYDLDAAEQLLEDSGYRYTPESTEVRVATADSLAVTLGYVPEGTPLEFDMLVRMECPEEREIAILLQYVYYAIGVELNVRIVDEVTLATEVYAYKYDTAIWYWSSDPDPNFMLFCQSDYAIGGWSDNVYSSVAYNENYNASVMALDYEDRKGFVDSCQRIHYEDAAYIILAYPHQTYAWRTDTFVGWGDWEDDPGRSLDAYWGANPLLFDLMPTPPNTAPSNVALDVPSEGVYAGYPAEFTVSADDADLDDLLFEVDFGDGETVSEESEGVSTQHELTLTHTYALLGDYEISVTVDDQTGLVGHEVVYGPVSLTVLEDAAAPETTISLEGLEGENGWYLSQVNVSLSATDGETEVDMTEWSLNEGVWTEYDDDVHITAEGVNDFVYRSEDILGNLETAQHEELKIDLGVPLLTADRESGFTSTSSTVVIGVEYSDAVSGVDHLEISVDGGVPVDVGLVDEVTLEDLGRGEHTVQLWAFDEAGHASTSILLEFEVETSVFALDGPAGPWIVLGILAALLAVVGVTGLLLYQRMRPPKPE